MPTLPENRPRLDWHDSSAVRRFFVDLHVAIDDQTAVARDMLRPPRQRHLGHAEWSRLHDEAADKIAALLAYAAPTDDA